jgi:mannose-6-phosphate isomerase-like protein (cupin superfamily)
MRAFVIGIALTVAASVVSAQQPGSQTVKAYSSAADVQALIAKAKSDRKGNQPNVSERILQLPPYNANLEYRVGVQAASVHEHEAEFFYVIDGSATMVTGGKLANERRTNAENLSGTGIEGGESQAISKGDFLVVPENTPHWITGINGTIVLMTLHVPRPVPAAH